LAVPIPFVHLHTAHGRPYGCPYSRQEPCVHGFGVLVRPQQAIGYAYPHITSCMRSLRFSLSSHRQNCSNHTMRLEKCLKNSSLDNWRVRNSVGAKECCKRACVSAEAIAKGDDPQNRRLLDVERCTQRSTIDLEVAPIPQEEQKQTP
jgi:hypothetical protein